ncbi:MAG: hypothetical protein IVW52_19505 [Acidimicrobiales bacterium]|nr:hypothetical protein [Acidimicrobiales bacterium]
MADEPLNDLDSASERRALEQGGGEGRALKDFGHLHDKRRQLIHLPPLCRQHRPL